MGSFCFRYMSESHVYEDIRRLVEEDPRNVKGIAKSSEVVYDSLQKFMAGKQKSLTADVAEKVYFEITGKLFTR